MDENFRDFSNEIKISILQFHDHICLKIDIVLAGVDTEELLHSGLVCTIGTVLV